MNTAQLYGVSTKRLVPKAKRHPLDLMSGTSVEYYVERFCLISKGNSRLALVFMQNNTAKLFDLKKFKKIDDLTFPVVNIIDPKPQVEVKRGARGEEFLGEESCSRIDDV